MDAWEKEYLDKHTEPDQIYGVARAYEEEGRGLEADEAFGFAHDLAVVRNLPTPRHKRDREWKVKL